jgi:hypothetical protein
VKVARAILLTFALVSTVLFVCAAIGRRLAPELLSFPIIAIALSQLLALRQERR